MTLLLSQYMGVGLERETHMLESSQHNQTNFVMVEVMTRYSTSVKEQKTMSCLLLFQVISESPRKMQKHVVDLRSVGSLAQSTLE